MNIPVILFNVLRILSWYLILQLCFYHKTLVDIWNIKYKINERLTWFCKIHMTYSCTNYSVFIQYNNQYMFLMFELDIYYDLW